MVSMSRVSATTCVRQTRAVLCQTRPTAAWLVMFVICPLAGLLSLQAAADEEGWIDLTHELSEEAVFWPTAEPFEMTTDFEGMTDKGYPLIAKILDHVRRREALFDSSPRAPPDSLPLLNLT